MPDELMTTQVQDAAESMTTNDDVTSAETMDFAAEAFPVPEANEGDLLLMNEDKPVMLPETDPETRDALLFGDVGVEEEGTAEPMTEPEQARERLLPNRISTAQFDAREQEAIALKHELAKHGEQVSLREACERVEAKYAGLQAAAYTRPDMLVPEPEPDAITRLQREAEALAARIDEMDGEVVTPEYSRLAREHAEMLADLKVARLEQRMAAERAHATRMAARESAKAETLRAYPTANDDDSLLGGEIARIYAELSADPGHPDRARFAQDDGPRWITERAVEAVTARLRKSGFTPAQARAMVERGATAEAPGLAEYSEARSAVPRMLPVTARGQRPAAESVLSMAEALEQARANPQARDEALGFGAGVVIR
jgi:hypothetical protein